jgi:hypothetical protein
MTENASLPPGARSAEIVQLDRRRGERRDRRGHQAYTPEVVNLLRVCGAEVRAADGEPSPSAPAGDRRQPESGDAPRR